MLTQYHSVWIVVSLEGGGSDVSTGWGWSGACGRCALEEGRMMLRGCGPLLSLYLLSPAPSTLLLSGSGVPAEPHSCSMLFTQGRLGLAFCTTEIWQVCES